MFNREKVYSDITNLWIRKTKKGSYSICDGIIINGKQYFVGDNGTYIHKKSRIEEIRIATILSLKYGKDVVLLPEISGSNTNIKLADIMVDGELIEIKSPIRCSKWTFKHAINSAKGQSTNIMINVSSLNISNNAILNKVEKLFYDTQCNFMTLCIVFKETEILKVFQRKKIGTAALRKQDVVPTFNDSIT